jgi:Domain of unknown function (DUF4190)
MNCYIHSDREAVGICVGCGKFICSQCTTPVLDKNYCSVCVSKGVPFQKGTSTNGLAITSLILSIIGLPLYFCYGFGIIFGIAALIFGYIARSQIKQSGNQQGGDGLAKAGIIIGWIPIAFMVCGISIIILLSILGPAIGNVFSDIILSI